MTRKSQYRRELRATDYNKRITVQQRTKSQTAAGGWSNVWSDLYSCFASVTPMRGIKKIEYSQLGFTVSYEVEMRKRVTNVNSKCQVIYGGNAFQIQSITMDDEKVYLDIVRK